MISVIKNLSTEFFFKWSSLYAISFFTVFLSIICFPNNVDAQNVEIRGINQSGTSIEILYNLNVSSGRYVTSLYVRRSSTYDEWVKVHKVTGDIGQGQRSGDDKVIVWDVLSEREELVGSWDFKLLALSEKKADVKKVKVQRKRYYPMSNIGFSSCVLRSPFGVNYHHSNYSSLLNFYIDLRTDFRMYAPGEFGLRDRSWIIGDMDGEDSGNNEVSGGGTDFTLGMSIQLSGDANHSWMLLFGKTLNFSPIFDEFSTLIGPYYARSNSAYTTGWAYGVLHQNNYSNFSFGLTLENLKVDPINPMEKKIHLVWTIGGTF